MESAKQIAEEEFRKSVLDRTQQFRTQRHLDKHKFKESQKLLMLSLCHVCKSLVFSFVICSEEKQDANRNDRAALQRALQLRQISETQRTREMAMKHSARLLSQQVQESSDVAVARALETHAKFCRRHCCSFY